MVFIATVFPVMSPVVDAQNRTEQLFWESIRCGDEDELRLYLEEYPGGAYVDVAIKCLLDAGKGDDEEKQTAGQQEKFTELLEDCDEHVEANRLTSGASGNALECYRSVLEQDPDNARALTGIRRIEDTYIQWIRSAIDKREIEDARRNLDKLKHVNPEHGVIAELASGIDQLQKEVQFTADKKGGGQQEEGQAESPVAAVDNSSRDLIGQWKAVFSSHYDGQTTFTLDIVGVENASLHGKLSIVGNNKCDQVLSGTVGKKSISVESKDPCAFSGNLTLARDKNGRINQFYGDVRITGLDQLPFVRFRRSR